MTWIAQHKLLFTLIICIVAGGVFVGLSQSGAPEPLLTTTTAEGTPALAGGDEEIIGTLLSLRNVTLTGAILSDPAFISLQDFGTSIIPEPQGRTNPFAPLNLQSATSSVPTQATAREGQIFTPRSR